MSVTRYKAIATELKMRLTSGFYADSGRLPSRRRLAEEFSASSRTIHKAFAELKHLGVIRTSSRGTSGTEIGLRSESRVVALVTWENDTLDFAGDPLKRTLLQCARADGYELVLVQITGNNLARQLAFWDAPFCEGFIFIYSTAYELIFRHLMINRVPFIVTNCLPENSPAYWIGFDYFYTVFQITGMLFAHGWRRIVYCSFSVHGVGAEEQAERWRDICDYYGLANYSPGVEFFQRSIWENLESWFQPGMASPELIVIFEIVPHARIPELVRELKNRNPALKMQVDDSWRRFHDPGFVYRGGNDDRFYEEQGRETWRFFREIKAGRGGKPHGKTIRHMPQLDFNHN